MRSPKIAVLILCTNERRFLKGVLNSLLSQTYKNLEIYVLDNNSTDGSIELVQSSKFSDAKDRSPTESSDKVQSQKHKLKVKIIKFSENLGYAKGNNIGLKIAFEEGAGFCLVLNCDTILKKNAVEEMTKSYQKQKEKKVKTGLIQSVILLANDRKKINSLGNVIHFLGFGYCQDYLKKYKPLKKDKKIISVSGAAMLVSKEFYKDVGGFDETFFMTAEDQDLSLRGFIFGYKHFLSAKALVYHHYYFGRHKLNKYREEKNRLIILLKNYSLKFLILLGPIFFLTELAVIFYSFFEGWFFLKLKTYGEVFLNLKTIIKNRKSIQAKRTIKDKILFSQFKATINFQPINNFIIQYLANPVYFFYYKIIYIFI